MHQENSFPPEVRLFARRQAWKFFIFGFLTLIGAAIATYISYGTAGSNDSYLIFFGPVVLGFGFILKATYWFIKPDQALLGIAPNPVLMDEVSTGRFFLKFFFYTFIVFTVLLSFISDISFKELITGALLFTLFSTTIATVYYWLTRRKKH